MVGKVKWFSANRGYGFLDRGDGTDLFVHFSAIMGEGFRTLEPGESVEYEVVDAPDHRKEAANVVKTK